LRKGLKVGRRRKKRKKRLQKDKENKKNKDMLKLLKNRKCGTKRRRKRPVNKKPLTQIKNQSK